MEEEQHIFVPKHIKVDEKESQEILERYNISLKQLPKILKNDVGIKGLNAKAGDLIKIIRISPTMGKTEFFRAVSDE